jgi:hypothetical protein
MTLVPGLIIREDMRDGPRVTPDSPADPHLLAPDDDR